ncbi:MAG TPA: P-loop NTPase [Candidatus Binataceae bacterium]|nr:P-loop NTPase [Candidatus Binataceae bacterium]
MRIFTQFEAEEGAEPAREQELVRENLSQVRAIVAIASAKGGVGKSVLAVNLSVALALMGRKVGIVDADLNAPSVVAMLGMKPGWRYPLVEGIEPAAGPFGIRVVASDLLPGGEPAPITFFGDDYAPASTNHVAPAEIGLAKAMRAMLGQARLGALDFLIIDLAPGLDQLYEIAKTAEPDAIILVSHPSALAVQAARHAIELAASFGAPVTGIVENMVGFNCDNCRSVRPLLPEGEMQGLARTYYVPILGRLPFDPRAAQGADRGVPFVREDPDSPFSKIIVEIAQSLDRTLAARARQTQSQI